MTATIAQRHAQILDEALTEFDTIQSGTREVRLQCLEDRRFCAIAGAQWEGALGEQFENKPRFEFNKVHLAVIRIFNEWRNNRITVDFTAKDGTPDDRLADTCDGLYRADEQACSADEAYDNAFDEGVSGGFGAWRLRACYEDDEDEDDDRQRVRMEPIFDADSSVFYDLDAKRQDKSDATKCFVINAQSRAGYIKEWNDDPDSWPKETYARQFDWCTPDVVYVAEYYRIEQKSERVQWFRSDILQDEGDLKVTEADIAADPEKVTKLEAMGFRLVREKRVKRNRVHKYILSGGKVLKDEGIIAGRCIPIIPFFGKRWYIDNVEQCMGHVRLAKDAQRLVNMLMSWLAEMAARFDIEKPIFTPEQVLGHATMWARDNVDKFPFLTINATLGSDGMPIPPQPIGYTRAPNIPPAMAALLQIAEQALSDLLGNQQAGEQLQPNLSGKAVELIQTRLDMQVFIYMSNLAKSMKRCGEVWLSMMRDIVVEQSRKMKVVDTNGEAGSVVMNAPALDAETGRETIDNDLTRASFDVISDVGPSSTTKRQATVRALTGMLQLAGGDPETTQILTSLALMNMEGEGLADVRDFYRQKLIRMGVVKPSEEERKELEAEAANAKNEPPDPQAQFLMASAQKAAAEAQRAQADTALKVAQTDGERADTLKTVAETEAVNSGQVLDVFNALKPEPVNAAPGKQLTAPIER